MNAMFAKIATGGTVTADDVKAALKTAQDQVAASELTVGSATVAGGPAGASSTGRTHRARQEASPDVSVDHQPARPGHQRPEHQGHDGEEEAGSTRRRPG